MPRQQGGGASVRSFLDAIRQVTIWLAGVAGYVGFLTLIFLTLNAWDLDLWRVGIACGLIHGYAVYYEFMSRHKEDN